MLELARLHGPRWGDPSLAEIEWLSRRSGPDDTVMLAMMWQMVFAQFIATYGKYLTDDAADLVDRFGRKVSAWADGRDGPWTVTHGDYRLDNLMFSTAAGGKPITAVDWQTPGHGPPMGDVSYFLGAGPLPADRAAIERGLVAEYVAALGPTTRSTLMTIGRGRNIAVTRLPGSSWLSSPRRSSGAASAAKRCLQRWPLAICNTPSTSTANP